MIDHNEHDALRLGRSLASVLLEALAATDIAPQDQRILWVGLISELHQYCEGLIKRNGDAHEMLRDAQESARFARNAIRAWTDVDALDSLANALRGYLTPRGTKLVAAQILERLAMEIHRNRYAVLHFGVRRYAESILKHREWLRYRRFAP